VGPRTSQALPEPGTRLGTRFSGETVSHQLIILITRFYPLITSFIFENIFSRCNQQPPLTFHAECGNCVATATPYPQLEKKQII